MQGDTAEPHLGWITLAMSHTTSTSSVEHIGLFLTGINISGLLESGSTIKKTDSNEYGQKLYILKKNPILNKIKETTKFKTCLDFLLISLSIIV